MLYLLDSETNGDESARHSCEQYYRDAGSEVDHFVFQHLCSGQVGQVILEIETKETKHKKIKNK